MKRYPPDRGPTRAAPPYFPYRHASLAVVWGHENRAVSVPKIAKRKSFCAQCDRMVSAAEVAGCYDRFCQGTRP